MKYAVVLIAFAVCAPFAHAQTSAVVELDVVPTQWRLENYVSDNPVVWYSGSLCDNGKLEFDSNATDEDKNRFWAMVMAAKLSGAEIFVRYEDVSDVCDIVSFGLYQT